MDGHERHKRAMSAIAPRASSVRPGTASFTRPVTARARPYSAYNDKGSHDEGHKYDHPATKREWWRFYLKETPTPGTYRLGSFLDELNKKTSGAYAFRSVSRKKEPVSYQGKGEVLMPGAYETKDFLHDMTTKAQTYNFKGVEREDGPKIGHGFGDKEMNTSPTWYNVVDYSHGLKDKNAKTSGFKDKMSRFPSPAFRIVEGPPPNRYEKLKKEGPAVSSCFKSKAPRFKSSATLTPGPGAYNVGGSKSFSSASIMHLSKKHGLIVEEKT